MRGTSLAIAAIVAVLPVQAEAPRTAGVVELAKDRETLPIRRVALYKSGVGYFEHTGTVTGNARVMIELSSGQLNDALQSLTAIDLGGGRVTGAQYGSALPLEQRLRTLSLDLPGNASDVDLYAALRGAQVEVTGAGGNFAGRLLAVDLRGEAKVTEGVTPESGQRRFLTVVSNAGVVRTTELRAGVAVRLLDGGVRTDVTRYLELLSSERNHGLRRLTLNDDGTGARMLKVSYLSEVPVWKSSYRVLVTDTQDGAAASATLQGWSVVDNTTGSDWVNVHLELVAGAPQSFVQPISTPYYRRRPEVPLPAEAELTPQTHESGDALAASTKIPQVAGVAGMVSIGSSAGGVAGGVLGAFGTAPAPVLKQMAMVDGQPYENRLLGEGMGSGTGPGFGGNMGGGVGYEEQAEASVAPRASGTAFDDFFAYSLTDAVTIRKNESALVPIVQVKVPVERVTLWSAANPVALRALWMTNSSRLTLDRGSFSIVENGLFGGEGLMDPVHAGEKRLLSYAADQAVRVTTGSTHTTRRVEEVRISKGVLTEKTAEVAEEEYLVRNAAAEARVVLVEQPVRPGWTVDSDPQPVEMAGNLARFRVATPAGKTVRLHVGQRHLETTKIKLVDRTEDQLTLLLRGANGQAALEKLQPVFEAHHAVLALDERIRAIDWEQTQIANEQSRLRENLKALKGTAEERALVTRYTEEFTAQEDRLAVLKTQQAALRSERSQADLEFQRRLAAVDIVQTL